ncbi:hypothetical protein HN018_21070 [Lichenicola cladoniae]|uniref:Uncharacterized protein n=1 Tax=Lichenicola cladoniae TaxID=1484109 RepID=A0A6M8HUJ2_9PROT|nr:hypothetical protein [Lichenicola cladoniae]NPD69429.1 hypothetical protein [Acetobacteraceae bacterium]QKE92193.1 hypothetical protein HN018_21070 [Lichenicola cladoniae]
MLLHDGMLVDVDQLGEVRNDGRPAIYVPGWTPTIAYLGLAPLVILCFQHDGGDLATWYLDENLNRLGGSVHELPPDASRILTEATCSLFDGLWAKIMETSVPPALDEREEAFYRLPEGSRAELLGLFLGSFDTGTRYVPVDEMSPGHPGSQVIDFGSRRQPLQSNYLHALLNSGALQQQNLAFIELGHMTFPSPIDGRPMIVRHALILHGVIYAYRAVDAGTGTVMFLIASEIYFRIAGIFIPAGRVFVGFDPAGMRAQMPDLFREFFARIMQHGNLLGPYFARGTTKPVHAWRGVTAMHIGHVLWNDISGIGSIVSGVPRAKLPRFMVFEAQYEPEMYGPLDAIFPELLGLVDRRTDSLMEAIPSFYENGQTLIRSSSMKVTADMRTRILATIRPLGPTSPASICREARIDSVPVIMFGVRVENRTIVELESFCTSLVTHLARTLGKAVLVVDGHNSRIGSRDDFIRSHGERGAVRSPIMIERDLVMAMRDAAKDTGIEIVDTIGLPITESLACGHEADALIAIWGAGLAKYRWVCNIPGLLLTNRWNLGHLGDRFIYHHPDAMENPTPLTFIPEDAVEDMPDAELVVRLGDDFIPSICNFRIDEAKVMAAIDIMLHEHALVPS